MDTYQLPDVKEDKPKNDVPRDKDFSLLNLFDIGMRYEIGAKIGYGVNGREVN